MIIKFQQGGASLAPLVSYSPVIPGATLATSTASSTPAATKDKSSDLTDKDLLEMLGKLDGLPSDMSVLTKTLLNFYIDQQYGAVNTSNIATRYLSVLNLMKVANFNKKEYDEAFNIVKSNGGINEVAVNEHGQLFCKNSEGDFKLMTVDQLKNSEDYKALTNSELLYYRALLPEMAGKNQLLNIVKNGLGMETVTKMIKDAISNLGETLTSNEEYARVKATQLIKGIKDFVEASKDSRGYNETLDSLYKGKKLSKNQAKQAESALLYLWQTLPENAKALLKYKSKDGSNKEGFLLMQLLVTSTLDETSQFDLDLKETPSTSIGKDGSKTSKKNGFEMDPVSLLQNGYGQKQKINIQTGSGGLNSIEVNTVRMPVVDKNGESIGTSATLDDISTSGFSGYLDFENASMGGVMIPTVGFSNIAINGTALYTAYLPVDIQEFLSSGNIKPDIGLLRRLKEAQDIINKENITDKDQINKIYQEKGLPVMFDGEGNVLTNYKKFGIVNATALDKAFNEDVGYEDYITEVSDENVINNTLTILNKGRGDKDRIDFDGKSLIDSIIGTDYDHVYKGTVFIPVNEDHFTSTVGFGNYPTTSEAEIIEAKQQAKTRSDIAQKVYNNPGRL